MLSFWLVVAVMIVLPLCIVLRPLLFPKLKKNIDDKQIEMAVYQARDAELETEVENGLLEGEQLSAVRDDLKRALLQEVENQADNSIDPTQTIKRDKWTAGIITILLPIAAIVIYLALGTPGTDKQANSHLTNENSEQPPSVEEMVSRLAARLQNEPDDQQGWFMLAKSYMVLGKYNQAIGAFERLYALAGEQPDVLSGYANALSLANNGRVTGKPEQLAQKLLEIEPDHSNGLWLVGMAAFEQGEFQRAVNYWQRLLMQLEHGSSPYNEVEKLIAYAEQQQGITKNQSEVLEPDQAPDPEVSKSISVSISLAEQLLAETDPADTLFIFARAIEGPPMPIAVIRKQVSDLPLTIVLDDSAAMMAQRKLSDFDKVIVGARISKTGDAIPQPGDLTGNNITVDMIQTDSVDILIDQKIP